MNPADCTGTDRLASPGPARRQPCPAERERESGAESPPAGGAGVEGVGRGGASPARPAPSELSVSGSRREEVPCPAGARAGRPAQRETAHPARTEPAALGTRSSAAAAAALGEPASAAAARVQVNRGRESRCPCRRRRALRGPPRPGVFGAGSPAAAGPVPLPLPRLPRTPLRPKAARAPQRPPLLQPAAEPGGERRAGGVLVSSPCRPPCGLGGASQGAPPWSSPGEQKAGGGEARTPRATS